MGSVLAMIISICTINVSSPSYGPEPILEHREKCIAKYMSCYDTKGQDMVICTKNKGIVK